MGYRKYIMKFRNIFVSIVIATTMIISAQIALPTFQAVHTPQTLSSSGTSGTFTFTNCDATGKDGPSQSNCNSEYSGTSLEGLVTVSSGIQTWTVPSTATYTIEVWGAKGGDGHSTPGTIGGKGARMKGNFSLTQGEELKILVGQMGTQTNTSTVNYGGGGGGGTFVAKSDNTPLIVAGGGGGAAIANNGNIDGTTSTNGMDGGYSGGSGSPGSGGTNGDGGGVGYSNSGGAGFTGNGGQGSSSGQLGNSPRSFINGGTGQNTSTPSGNCCGGNGGFGGGSAGYGPGGGGGGYSGGGGGGGCCQNLTSGGGGGGSYNNGSSEDNSSGVWESHGKVIIIY